MIYWNAPEIQETIYHPLFKILVFFYEYDLIMIRAGVYPDINKYKSFKICASHRSLLGLNFINKNSCEHPFHQNQSNLTSCYRKVNYNMAIRTIELRKIGLEPKFPFIQLGIMLCLKCYDIFQTNLKYHFQIDLNNRFSVLQDMCEAENEPQGKKYIDYLYGKYEIF